MFGITRDAVTPEQTHLMRQVRVVGHRHAAFCGGDDLDRMKAEHRDVAEAAIAHRRAFVFGTNGMRGIFDDLETILHRQRVDGRHVTGLSAHVHRHHHLG